MNTKRVKAAEGVIFAAMQTKRTAAGLAVALEAACLLQSPEVADEMKALRARVDEVERRYTFDTAELKRERDDHRAAAERAEAKLRKLEHGCETPESHLHGCACASGHDAERPNDVRPQVAKLRGIFAGQRASLEDPHDSPLHHDYRTPRELPALGGTDVR